MKARLPTFGRKGRDAEAAPERTRRGRASGEPGRRRWLPRIGLRLPEATAADDVILRPYRRRTGRLVVIGLMILMVGLCFLEGFGFATFAPFRMVPFFFPIGILGAVTIWALPEFGAAPTRALEWMFFIAFLALPLWPNYLAIALPGLPWITLARLTHLPLVFLLLLSVSISATFRSETAATLRSTPLLWKMIVTFSIYMALSVGLSNRPQNSIDLLVTFLINWTAVFFVSAYIFTKPGRVQRFMTLIWLIAIGLSILALWEYRMQHLPWEGHIPRFLAVEDPSVARSLAVKSRAGTSIYRAEATFSTPLGLSEYLALITPFVLHLIFGPYKLYLRIMAAMSIPLILSAIITTDSRLGFVGFLLSNILYVFFWGVLRWRQRRGSLWGPAVVLSYPATMVFFMAAILFIPRLRVMTLGGAKTNPSTEARKEQVREGLPLVFKHPFGHGIGRGAVALGFRNAAGEGTIDTYWLLIALDYGIFGFFIFYSIFWIAIIAAGRSVIQGPSDKEQTILIPLAISLVCFFVIKSIYSGVENQSMVFMMLGAVAALTYRVKVGHGMAKASKLIAGEASQPLEIAPAAGR